MFCNLTIMPDYHQPALMTIWGNGGRKLSNIIRFSFSFGTIICFPTLFIWFFSIKEKDKWAFSLWTISNWLILSIVKISLGRDKLLTNYHACLYDLLYHWHVLHPCWEQVNLIALVLDWQYHISGWVPLEFQSINFLLMSLLLQKR